MVFTVGNGVLSLYDTVLIVLLPIWVIEHTAVPVALVPVLMAVNTVLTVLLQVYVARFADSPAAAIRLLVLSGALMAVCCGFFAMAQAASATFAILAILVAVVVLSVAENIQEVAAWELSAELSPEAARARYLGAFSLGFSGQKVIGPTLLVVVLLPDRPDRLAGAGGSLRAACPDFANSGAPLSRRAWRCRHFLSDQSPTH